MKKVINSKATLASLIAFMGLHLPQLLSAQSAADATPAAVASMVSIGGDVITMITYVLLAIILLTLLFIINSLRTFISYSGGHTADVTVSKPSPSIVSTIMQKMSGAVPLEEEETILTDHSYDGIRELDNDMPPWWVYMFYATIIFSFVYIYYYHFSGYKMSQLEEYQQELVQAEIDIEEYRKTAANSIDETNAIVADAKGIESGKAIYMQSCVACHGAAGEGGVGPNLTDEYWLHGGDIKNIFKTVKYGVPSKGMIAWQSQLTPQKMQEVSSYITSIKGTNPPNPKAPQGDKEGGEATVIPADSTIEGFAK